MADLILPLKGLYFDEIERGVKPFEYRLMTDYWRKRLEGRQYDHVVLTRGYPKGGGIEGKTRLTRRWQGYHEITLKHPHFGPDEVDVYAIYVGEQSK